MLGLRAKKGLALKTFAFALILMTLVMAVSLGILYVFLPSYYFRHKNAQLSRNADILQQQLIHSASVEDSAMLIAEFSEANNASVVAFDEENRMLPEFFPAFFMGNFEPFEFEVIGITPYNEREPYHTVTQTITPHVQLFTTHPSQLRAAEEGIGVRIAMGRGPLMGQNITSVFLQRDIAHPDISHLFITSTLQPIDEAQEVIISMLPYLFAAGFAIALAAAIFFSRQLTKPILAISDAASQMREMKPGVASTVQSGDELGQLSQNLNKLYRDLCANMEGLQKEMEHTARLEQSKTDFMRAAGHELKTPIAALSGMLDGMIDHIGPYKDHDKYLPECKDQTRRLAKLVNEILVASEHVNDSAELETVDIRNLVNEALDNHKALIEKKRLNLKVDYEGVNENTYKSAYESAYFGVFQYATDPRLLFNALSNLLSNAVKYTPECGNITIAITSSSTDGMIFSIENECPPVDASTLTKWFEPFYTPDYSRDKSKSGTGLGLYIVKKNLDALQLPFEVTATDKGVRFEILFL